MENRESVQYSAALAVTGAWKVTSHDKWHDELGWESLHLRRWSRRLILFYKIVNNLTSDYTKYQISHLQESNYDFRRHATVGQICERIQGFKSSSYPNCLSELEKLDPEVRLASSVNIFKRKLLSIICPPPKSVYRIHDPKGLSILKDDLHSSSFGRRRARLPSTHAL